MTADRNDKDTLAQDGLESESSTDWEEAFQAEDFLMPSEATPPVVPESSAGVGPMKEGEQPSRPLEAGTETGRIAASPGKRTKGATGSGVFFETLGGNRFIGSLFDRLPSSLRQWPAFRSAKGRGAFLSLTLVLCLVLSLVLVSQRLRQPAAGDNPLAVRTTKDSAGPVKKELAPPSPGAESAPPSPAVESAPPSPAAESAPPPQTAESAPPVSAASPPVVTPASGEGKPADFGATRRKWRFSSFMIDASQDASTEPSYVVVDLSLVLQLRPGEAFPQDKEYVVREMIYQFFSNRPLYELRRFSLARGEMKVKLEAWFRKEWPNNPIESIFFHRYQII